MYDNFYDGGMLGNECYYGGEPMQTLDDAYYYGGEAFNTEGGCSTGGCSIGGGMMGGCSTGGCPIDGSMGSSMGSSMMGSGMGSSMMGSSMGGCSLQGDMPAIGGSSMPMNYYEGTQGANGMAMPYLASTGYFESPVSSASSASSTVSSAASSISSGSSSSSSAPCPMHDAAASSGQTEQITVLLNGTVPVELHATSITVGNDTYPLHTEASASSIENPLLVGQSSMDSINLSDAVVMTLPMPTESEIRAQEELLKEDGITVAQLKKDQEASCKDKKEGAAGKKGKKGKKCKKAKKAAAAVKPKKNGVAGASALVAIAVLPVIALFM